jgi:phage/plasmid-associated DNA primase
MKGISGGEKLPIRQLYKQAIEMTIMFQWWVVSNGAVEFWSCDSGIARRNIAIEFLMSFVDNPIKNTNQRQIDNSISLKIKTFVPALFKKLVERYHVSIKHIKGTKVTPIPEAVQQTSKDVLDNHSEKISNKLKSYNASLVKFDNKTPVQSLTVIYDIRVSWSRWNMTMREFSNNMEMLNYFKTRRDFCIVDGDIKKKPLKKAIRCWAKIEDDVEKLLNIKL